MEIVIDSPLGKVSFGIEKGDISWAREYNKHIVKQCPSLDADAVGVDTEKGSRSGLTLTLSPLPGREEVVERFVAIGKLQNANFPFRVKEEEDGDRD